MKINNVTCELGKKTVKWALLLCLLIFMPLSMSAQAIDEEEDDDEPDEEDEITVVDQNGDEEVIEFPEAMTYDLDSLLNLYMSQTYLDEQDCNMKDVNPEYSKEEYVDRLYRMPCVMEMAYNDVVQKFIDRYSGRLRRSISYMLGASNFYMPIFEEALEMYQLPLELKYLPIIESALNPKAVSRVGAAGLWQFMPATGKQYGLKLNSLVDERRDPVLSSQAAARYLRDLYKIFGDWNLVIAAYNCGPGNVNKAIHRAGGETDYWKIYPHLPRETRGYVPAFIAANYIMNYYCEHNICPMDTRLPLHTDTIHVDRDLHFNQIAAVIGIDVNQLKELNPQYRRNIVNGSSGTASIRMPLPYIMKFIDLQDSIYNYQRSSYHKKRPQVAINEAPSGHAHRPRRSEPDQKSEAPSVNQQDTYGSKGKTRHKKEYQNTPKNNRRRSHGK